METIIVDRDDWEELVQAAIRAQACLGVLEKLLAQKWLTMTPPDSADPGEIQKVLEEFSVMLASNRERLQEALIPYEDEIDEEDGEEESGRTLSP